MQGQNLLHLGSQIISVAFLSGSRLEDSTIHNFLKDSAAESKNSHVALQRTCFFSPCAVQSWVNHTYTWGGGGAVNFLMEIESASNASLCRKQKQTPVSRQIPGFCNAENLARWTRKLEELFQKWTSYFSHGGILSSALRGKEEFQERHGCSMRRNC